MTTTFDPQTLSIAWAAARVEVLVLEDGYQYEIKTGPSIDQLIDAKLASASTGANPEFVFGLVADNLDLTVEVLDVKRTRLGGVDFRGRIANGVMFRTITGYLRKAGTGRLTLVPIVVG